METARVRFQPLVEWAVAGACIAAVLAAGSLAVREVRTVSPVTPVIARETPQDLSPPNGVPPRSVSVPMLLLPGGGEVRVGDTLSAVADRLGRQAEAGYEAVDRTSRGGRLTRSYDHGGTPFVLVFEPLAAGAQARVAAIYLP